MFSELEGQLLMIQEVGDLRSGKEQYTDQRSVLISSIVGSIYLRASVA